MPRVSCSSIRSSGPQRGCHPSTTSSWQLSSLCGSGSTSNASRHRSHSLHGFNDPAVAVILKSILTAKCARSIKSSKRKACSPLAVLIFFVMDSSYLTRKQRNNTTFSKDQSNQIQIFKTCTVGLNVTFSLLSVVYGVIINFSYIPEETNATKRIGIGVGVSCHADLGFRFC